MKAIYGLFSNPEKAERAFDRLVAEGFAPREIIVMSSEPLEEYEFASHDRQTLMPWIAVLGGVIGLSAAYLLTSLTQTAWAINTGGMPIVSNYTNLIVMFELTMLGAVFATVITLVVTGGLGGRLPEFYDPEISNGNILIGVAAPEASKIEVTEAALRSCAPVALKKI